MSSHGNPEDAPDPCRRGTSRARPNANRIMAASSRSIRFGVFPGLKSGCSLRAVARILRGMRRDNLNQVLNVSINQTLGRTVITAGTALFSAIALFLFGGGP